MIHDKTRDVLYTRCYYKTESVFVLVLSFDFVLKYQNKSKRLGESRIEIHLHHLLC